MAWSFGAILHTFSLLILVVLLDISGVLLAHAFSFHSRINEWGEDDEQRRSYRRLLMMATVAPAWAFTALGVVIELHIRVLPRNLYTGLDELWLAAVIICFLLIVIALLCLPFLLYYQRPVGTVNRSQDRYWKFGLFYFNRQDEAWVVPARLGAGISLNYGRPLAWLLIMISAAGFGVRWYGKSPNPNYEPNSVQSQFATASMQLRGGEFAASDRLLYMARHNDDPAVWSSVAYELTKNHVKPDSARQWAKRAVTQEEQVASQIPLLLNDGENREEMARLAALWSNLGYVCSWQGDLDCAQRYLVAAWALHPLPGYRDELAVVLKAVPKPQDGKILATLEIQNGVPVRTVVNVSVPGRKAGTAYLNVVLSPKEPVAIRWASGDENLSGAAELVGRTSDFPWPDDVGNERIQLREKLTCVGVGSACELVVVRPEDVVTAADQRVN